MPTNMQLKWLQMVLDGKIKKKDDSHKYAVYLRRLRERIDSELDSLEWIAENFPSILNDEQYEIENYGLIKKRRLKKLMGIVKTLYPEADPVLVKYKKEIGLN